MLERLHIQNFAVIKELSLELAAGLTVLTGETGAGKSIIVDALSLLLGGRTSVDMIRTGCERALVQGVFAVESEAVQRLLSEQGVEDGGELIITREITPNRTSCRVNGRSVTQGLLRQLGAHLVDMHGQHEHQSLLSQAAHQQLIDRFVGPTAEQLLAALMHEAKGHAECQRELKDFAGDERERVRLLDLINHQLQEIDAARLRTAEEDDLRAERGRLLNFEKLRVAVERSYTELYGGGRNKSVSDVVGRIRAELRDVQTLAEDLGPICASLEQAGYLLEDAARELGLLKDSLYFDQGRLEQIEQRLDLINKLKRKYGDSVERVLIFRQEAMRSKERLENAAVRIAALEQRMASHRAQYTKSAAELTAMRLKRGAELCRLAEQNIRELGMRGGRLNIAVTAHSDSLSLRGAESMELLFSANLGEELKPLAKIASGGELSRVMLALKAVFSGMDDIPTLVFDEVDSGVGGKAALTVAEKIAAVSLSKQVLCVSHLAQIAAVADCHLYVRKDDNDGRATVTVEKLGQDARIRELARMLSGSESAAALEHAVELLSRRRVP